MNNFNKQPEFITFGEEVQGEKISLSKEVFYGWVYVLS